MYFVDFWSPFSTCQLYLQAGNSKQRHQALTVSTTNIVMANRESYSYCCCSCCCSCYVMSGTYSASYRFDIHRLLLPATRCLRRCFDCRFYLDSTRFTSRHPLGKQQQCCLVAIFAVSDYQLLLILLLLSLLSALQLPPTASHAHIPTKPPKDLLSSATSTACVALRFLFLFWKIHASCCCCLIVIVVVLSCWQRIVDVDRQNKATNRS